MQRTPVSSTNKRLNILGECYKAAKKADKLKFQVSLLEFQEKDGTDYWRAFRDVWQFSDRLGIAPFNIISAASTALGFSMSSTSEQKSNAV